VLRTPNPTRGLDEAKGVTGLAPVAPGMWQVQFPSSTFLLVLAIAAAAVWVDFRTHRIPNRLVLIGLIAGLAVQSAGHGWWGLPLAVGGATVGVALLLPFYAPGSMGAGDVKLMSALGAILGPGLTVAATALTLVAGALLAAFAMTRYRAGNSGSAPSTPGSLAVSTPKGLRIPYASAIAAGSCAALVLQPSLPVWMH